MGLLGLDDETGFEGRDILGKSQDNARPTVVFSRSATEPPAFALRDDDHAFIYHPLLDKAELFDRRRDPHERHDIAEAHPELVQRYRSEVTARADRLSDPIVPPASKQTPELLEQLEALGYVE
jgi:hypothetical protein